jgi:DNA mismatch repair protein MutS
MEINEGRHPVIEKVIGHNAYVPNNTYLDESKNLLLITGPNMGGKSTYMRQVTLIVIMAQIGCFVPAKYANLSVVDQIFTRIGASDDLVSGQSTFMVEMSEANNALRYATNNSLIIFDEIGRGTSTYDGMALAQSIIEYIACKIQAFTLFSTHYHELTRLEGSLPGLKNISVGIHEENDKVTFLYKMTNGATNKSYGINVARLAHLPETLLDRAKDILSVKESNGNVVVSSKIIETKKEVKQLPSYVEELNKLNPLEMTPLEALTYLFELQKKVKEGNK